MLIIVYEVNVLLIAWRSCSFVFYLTETLLKFYFSTTMQSTHKSENTGSNHKTQMDYSSQPTTEPIFCALRFPPLSSPQKFQMGENVLEGWRGYWRSEEVAASKKFKLVQEGDTWHLVSLKQGCWNWRTLRRNFRFMWPCIIIVGYEKNQLDVTGIAVYSCNVMPSTPPTLSLDPASRKPSYKRCTQLVSQIYTTAANTTRYVLFATYSLLQPTHLYSNLPRPTWHLHAPIHAHPHYTLPHPPTVLPQHPQTLDHATITDSRHPLTKNYTRLHTLYLIRSRLTWLTRLYTSRSFPCCRHSPHAVFI